MSYRKPRTAGLETDIEKAREEGNWRKVIELASQLKEKPEKQHETLGWFLVGEGKLEEYLEEFPAKEENVREAKLRLKEAKSCLERTIQEEGKRLGVHLDSWILLAKLHYAMGNFTDALKFYDKAQIESLEEKQLPARSLKIMAEAFAIKGFCYEKLPLQSSSKQKQLDRENKVIKCFELSGDLTLLYLQEADRVSRRGQSTLSMQSVGVSSGTSNSPVPPPQEHNRLGFILESALMKAPLLNLKSGKVDKAVESFRSMLMAEETGSTSSLRLGVARQLAEVLMHSVSDADYKPPDIESPRRTSSRQGQGMNPSLHNASHLTGSTTGIDSPWKPRKHAGTNLFQPSSRQEEIVLLLLLAEGMANRAVPLNQTSEFDKHRDDTTTAAHMVYNLMTIALARHGHFKTLCDMFEKSMRFSAKKDHIWSQFSLALASEGKNLRALAVLQEHVEQDVQGCAVSPCLVASRLCLEKLSFLDEGIEWAEKALRREEMNPQEIQIRSRCHLYLGIGHNCKAGEVETREERDKLKQSALRHLQIAVENDPGDHLAQFYLGLVMATQRNLAEAHTHSVRALQLQPSHLASLHLAILVFSARGEMEEALRLCRHALQEYPDNLVLLGLRARLEETCLGGEVALATAKHMLNLLRDRSDYQRESTDSGIGEGMENRSVVAASYSHWDAMSEKDSVSLQGQSVAASVVERTLSEVASSLSSAMPRYTPQDAVHVQIRTWLLTAELYLRLGQPDAADQCANEARQLYPLSYHILYIKGAIHQHRGEYETAKVFYENSLSIFPGHLESLQALGLVHLQLGSPRLAEQTLRAAIKLDPHSHVSWVNLGTVLETIEEECDTASKCFATASSIQASSPILPFYTIPICFE